MSPQEFISKWRASTLNERASSQEHIIDLCRLLDEPTHVQADPTGTFYRFEMAVSKTLGGEGAADVWKRVCFGWEYKGKKRDLHQACAQLLNYSVALENPPLLVVSDMATIRLHTNFTNSVQLIHNMRLDDLLEPQTRASTIPQSHEDARPHHRAGLSRTLDHAQGGRPDLCPIPHQRGLPRNRRPLHVRLDPDLGHVAGIECEHIVHRLDEPAGISIGMAASPPLAPVSGFRARIAPGAASTEPETP